MWEIKRILCPIDFSEFSAKAFDYAQSLARHYSARLFLQHVVQRPLTSSLYYSFDFPQFFYQYLREFRADAEKRLHEFAGGHILNGIQTDCVVQEGPATDGILSFAKAQSVDLIVMGTHGLRGVDRLVLGSVTEKVLRKAGCPVLAVRKTAHDFVSPEQKQDPVQLRKILLCTDFSEYAHRALQYALSLAMEYRAELTLVHVLQDVPSPTELESVTRQLVGQLEELIPPEVRERCTVKSSVRIGKPNQEIIQLALEAQTDLIVLGVYGRNAVDLLLFGSTTHRVIQLGCCPVLAVRGYSWGV